MQIHLIQCRKNNPVTAKHTKRCPFNAKHVIPSVELSFHKMMCPDRATGIVDREILHDTKQDILNLDANSAPVINHQFQSDENWEAETVEDSEPFIFGSKYRQKRPTLEPPRQPRNDPTILDNC